MCLLVRHAEDADPRLSLKPDERWKGDSFSLAGRDPVLTANGILAARGGFTEQQASQLRPGYRGMRGGIQSKIMAFQPTLIVTSPLRRSLLTTAFACEHISPSVPIIAHPNLRELKSSKVHARTPNHVKPGAHGVPFHVLEETLKNTPRGGDINLSLIPKGHDGSWHGVGATPGESKQRALLFLDWLKERPEERIIICTHGKVLRLPRFGGINFLHGEVRKFHFDGHTMVHDPSFHVDAFEPEDASGGGGDHSITSASVKTDR